MNKFVGKVMFSIFLYCAGACFSLMCSTLYMCNNIHNIGFWGLFLVSNVMTVSVMISYGVYKLLFNYTKMKSYIQRLLKETN